MKNKKAEQIEAKLKHKERIKTKRRRQQNFDRSKGDLNTNGAILIVCEGENTEPSYFKF